jgi:DNA-binding MarR family transcriptional regulator
MRMGAPRKEISELELLAFCEAPQTLKTLGEKFKLSASVIKRITDEMVAAELLIMHQSKRTRTAKYTFTARARALENIWHFAEPPFRAHDPFGLITKGN